MNFDRYPEPNLSETLLNEGRFRTQGVKIEGTTHHLGVPHFLDKSAHKGKIRGYFADLTDRRKLPGTFAGRMIVRPEHRFFPYVTHKIYRQLNATASDEPWIYINIYANSDFTLFEQVHACVATLVFGSPAMFFAPSPRSALFGRVGLEDVKTKMVTLHINYLNDEQDKESPGSKSTSRRAVCNLIKGRRKI